MKHEERALHIAIVDYLARALPDDAVFAHYPSGEYRTAKTGALLKRMGTQRGVPDILIWWSGKTLAIEVKAAGGKVSTAQIDMAKRLQRAGVVTTIAYKMEAVEAFLRSVGMPLKAKLARGQQNDAA